MKLFQAGVEICPVPGELHQDLAASVTQSSHRGTEALRKTNTRGARWTEVRAAGQPAREQTSANCHPPSPTAGGAGAVLLRCVLTEPNLGIGYDIQDQERMTP